MEVTYSSTESFFPSGVSLSDVIDSEDKREWREGLRRQVEEDIDRKVKLRLRSDIPFKVSTKGSHTHDQLHYYRLRRKTNRTASLQNGGPLTTATQAIKLPSISKRNTKDDLVASSTNVSKKHAKTGTAKHSISEVASRKKQIVPDLHASIKGKSHAGSIRSTKNRLCLHDSEEAQERTHNLSGIYEYVHDKYGCPYSQLLLVAKSQSFQTSVIDTSGCGKGPLIRSPVESNICLGTPKHFYIDSKKDKVKPTVIHRKSSLTQEASSRDDKSKKCNRANAKGTLEFESRFESGNLWKVSPIGPREYQIWMSPDLYSQRHTQWFYFRITGMVAEEPYKFHIVNFVKPDSLYNQGMQPLLYSERVYEMEGEGWTRVGVKVSYSRSAYHQSQPLYTLTWTMKFPHSEDCCYLAYCFPYPYSQLLTHLETLGKCPHRSKYLTQEVLCETLAGNQCPLLTITDAADKDRCPSIIISARVHPGETNSSWMMEGLLDFLLSESDSAQELRRNYLFKLIPMLNPDGVIVGNYRTSLAGVDLNRVYKCPDNTLFPTVYHTKKLISEIKKERKLVLYVDLHGHSRKKNVFTYGCHTPGCSHMSLLQEHLIPFLLSKESPMMFDYHSCKFDMQRCKEATGRIVVWKMGISNSFTLESTFCGSSLTDTKKQFSVEDLKAIGSGLGKAIYNFHKSQLDNKYKKAILSEIASELLSKISQADSTMEQPVPVQQHVPLQQAHRINSFDKTKPKSSVLQRFLNADISKLERDSSTSGSDSDNDTFTWKSIKKVKRKKEKFKSPYACGIETEPRSIAAQRIKHSTSMVQGSSLRLPQIKSTPHPQVSTEPSSTEPVKLPAVKKFVSKYKDRSNGGIPIFSEERIKERRDKRLVQDDDLYKDSKPILKQNKSDSFKEHTKSLWTLHKTLDLFKEAYSAQETEGKASTIFGNKHLTKVSTGPLRMEQLKLSADLQKFIKDSWKF